MSFSSSTGQPASVRIWHSFSSNNSSSHYLVARFESEHEAVASAEELRAFFRAHAVEVDREGLVDAPTAAASDFALAHRFEWSQGANAKLVWGNRGVLRGDEPTVFALSTAVVVHHHRCSGFGESIPRYFAAKNAAVDHESYRDLMLGVIIDIPTTEAGAEAVEVVQRYVTKLTRLAEKNDGHVRSLSAPPWGLVPRELDWSCGNPFPAWNDGRKLGFVLELEDPKHVGHIAEWFDRNGLSDYRFLVDDPGLLARFRTIAAAACPACEAHPMSYVEEGERGAHPEQLACDSCGGMFALASLSIDLEP